MSGECSAEISLGAFGERLQDRIGGRRYPLGGSMIVTERCNLRCVHCLINQGAGRQDLAAKEMTSAQIKALLDEIVAEGCLHMMFTGGEIFLRPDFLDIYTHAKKLGLLVTLYTNGTLVGPQIADYLAEWRPFKIEISLYGATQETYEGVTGVTGSYARCRAAIDLLLDRGLPLGLKTMILTVNHHERLAMEDLARSLGCQFRYDAMIVPRLDGTRSVERYSLSGPEIAELDRVDPERQESWQSVIGRYGSQRRQSERILTCGAGYRSFNVDPYGQASVCMLVLKHTYDLTRGSFHAAWHEFFPTVRAMKRTGSTPCDACDISLLCTQCCAWSELVHQDSETPVDLLCQVAHLRAEHLGITHYSKEKS